MVGLNATYVHHSAVPGVGYGIKPNQKVYSKELYVMDVKQLDALQSVTNACMLREEHVSTHFLRNILHQYFSSNYLTYLNLFFYSSHSARQQN